MISDKNWDFFINDMFKEASKQYKKSYTHQKSERRRAEISKEIFDNYEKEIASKFAGYIFEFEMLSCRRAKEYYVLGMKDAISLLKRLDAFR